MKFAYEARTAQGQLQQGVVEARDREAALSTLQRHNLIVVHLEAASDKPFFERSITLFDRIKQQDIVLFYRQLSTLFSAGVSLVESFTILRDQITNVRFRDILFRIESDVRAGMALSKALEKHPDVFTALYVSIVRSGEETGKLGEVLGYLADHAEEEHTMESKIRGAMVYPVAITVIFILVGILMMVFVVPQLTTILTESGQELPLPTKILIFTSDLLRNWGWLLFLALVGAGGALWRWVRTDEGGAAWDFWKLKIPIFGELLRNIYLARFAENLAILIRGDLPILQALTVSADVVGNVVYRDIILAAREKVKAGATMSSVFEQHEEFPPLVVQMMRVGERSAQVGELLEKIAAFYRREVNQTVANLTQIIEPVMIVILGLAVAGLVSTILLPIYNISSGL